MHVRDNNNLDLNDKFSKLRPLFDSLNRKFLENAPVKKFHSLDKAKVPYFGRHGAKQFIKGKPIRWGYKLWVGATRLGYINWFEQYQGSGCNVKYKDLGLGASVALTYADVLLSLNYNLPYHIFFDNFFYVNPITSRAAKERN